MAGEVLSEPEQLRDHLVAKAQSIADFTGIDILSRKTGNLQNEIERALLKLKVCIAVILPDATFAGGQYGVAVLDQRIVFRCLSGLGNKTGKSALYLACRVGANFQLYRAPFPFVQGVLRAEDNGMRELNIVSGKPDDDESVDIAGFDVSFRVKITIAPRPIV